jgi:hypothetical protein
MKNILSNHSYLITITTISIILDLALIIKFN